MFTKIKSKLNIFLLITVFLLIVIWQGINLVNQRESQVLRIGINDWPGYAIAYYGQEKGIFEKRGIKVELIVFNNLQDSIRATLQGNLDATFSTLWDLMQADIAQEKPVFLMVTDISAGSDGIVAQNNIKTVEDLKGKKIAAKLGTINHLILLEALQLYNIEPNEVQIENLINEVAAQRMRIESLDAAVLWQPLLGKLAKEIDGNIIFTTKDVDSLVIDGFVSRGSFIKTHQKELVKFMLGWFDIIKMIEHNPHEVFKVVTKKIGQTTTSFKNDYRGLKKGDPILNETIFKGRLQEAQTQIINLLKKDLRHSRLIRNDIEINNEIIETAIEQWKNHQN